jgi:hypothetical protein
MLIIYEIHAIAPRVLSLRDSQLNRVVKPGEVKNVSFLEPFTENNEIIFSFFTNENSRLSGCWIETTLLLGS